MKVKELKKILEKADNESKVLLRVLDIRQITENVKAWVDDSGLLVIEEGT